MDSFSRGLSSPDRRALSVEEEYSFGKQTVRKATASSIVLKAISTTLIELEGDASLGRRIKASQELARLLSTVAEGDAGVIRLCDGRGVPSLLVALMDVCGEEREVTRNTILESLARLVGFVDGPALQRDSRLWALMLRMLYQRDETSVLHALAVILRMSRDEACLEVGAHTHPAHATASHIRLDVA